MDDEDEDTTTKRQKRGGPMSRPSYLSYTSFPPTTPLPAEMRTPCPRSHLLLSETDDGRPVVSFSDHNADEIKNIMEDAWALKTVHPIPPGIGVFYYEAEVLDRGKKGNITLGFMLKAADPRRLVGWDKGTYGWHGDDGKIFEQSGEGGNYSEPWKGA
jgi:hypothetical protein